MQNLLSSNLPSKNVKIKIYRTIILPVVLYGCESWSLIMWEEGRLRVFGNRVLRRIFGPKKDLLPAWPGTDCISTRPHWKKVAETML